MLFGFQKKKRLIKKKRPEMTKHRDNDNPNHEENAIEFFLHGREKPTTHEQQ